jgi:hypothetical protein
MSNQISFLPLVETTRGSFFLNANLWCLAHAFELLGASTASSYYFKSCYI